MEPNDAMLLNACRWGDEFAWDLLVERYQRLIFTIARRAGLSEEDSAEVLQRVFLTLLEQLDNIQQPARLSAWLMSTARHEAWRIRRRERYLHTVSSDDDAFKEAPGDPEYIPEAQVMRLEQQHQVQRALNELDERCRTLLTVLFLSPDPPAYAEIATLLQMREGAIGPTRARCLEKLRRIMLRVDPR